MDSEVCIAVDVGVRVADWGRVDLGPYSVGMEFWFAAPLHVRHFSLLSYMRSMDNT
jgi:hypothetical protein